MPQLMSFDQREDFDTPGASSAMDEDAAREAAADRMSVTSEQYQDTLCNAGASLSQVLKKERRAIQRMRKNDEAALAEVLRKEAEEDYRVRVGLLAVGDDDMEVMTNRRRRMKAYFKEREEQRAHAAQNMDSIEKNLAGEIPSKGGGGRDQGSPSKVGVGKGAAAATNTIGGDGARHPLGDTLGAVHEAVHAAGDGQPAEEPEEKDAEALLQARLAQYEQMDVSGKIASLRRRMACDNQMLTTPMDRPQVGDVEGLKVWHNEMSKRTGQIHGEVQHYQELMREKLERIGARPETPAVAFRATVDPASAVREALSKYHKQCLVTDSYYATGKQDVDASGMAMEERGEILDAVAALDDGRVAPAPVRSPRR